jgi:hypothetical protein
MNSRRWSSFLYNRSLFEAEGFTAPAGYIREPLRRPRCARVLLVVTFYGSYLLSLWRAAFLAAQPP